MHVTSPCSALPSGPVPRQAGSRFREFCPIIFSAWDILLYHPVYPQAPFACLPFYHSSDLPSNATSSERHSWTSYLKKLCSTLCCPGQNVTILLGNCLFRKLLVWVFSCSPPYSQSHITSWWKSWRENPDRHGSSSPLPSAWPASELHRRGRVLLTGNAAP